DTLVANAKIAINAPPAAVWDALTTPAAIKQYMFGADVKSQWKVGSDITWSGEMKGKPYQDKGKILAFERGHKLAYSHFSPLAGKPDKPENYHNVAIRLEDADGSTQVSLTQDNNADAQSKTASEKNWKAMLSGLKDYVEGHAA
ncbi:MAG: SRPBCC domain-containing protein, partial [Rudaea sp.]